MFDSRKLIIDDDSNRHCCSAEDALLVGKYCVTIVDTIYNDRKCFYYDSLGGL